MQKLAREAEAWARENLAHAHGDDADAICKRLVQDLGCAGYLKHAVTDTHDVRSIAVLREVFAYHAGLADFAFVMQGLGSGPIALAGSDGAEKAILPKAAANGDAIAAFALSEPDAGSDVQALTTTRARRKGDGWVLDGTKTWISNGGIADFYVVFAKSETKASAPSWSMPRTSDASERIDIVAPHPMATVKCRGSKAELLGEAGAGLQARDAQPRHLPHHGRGGGARLRAARAATRRWIGARDRKMFGQTLADFQMTQAKLADMATAHRRRRAAHLSRGVDATT